MSYEYINKADRDSPTKLPDVEIFYTPAGEILGEECDDCGGTGYGGTNTVGNATSDCTECAGVGHETLEAGWYYWTCLPECLPESDPIGPFDTEKAALAAAVEVYEGDILDDEVEAGSDFKIENHGSIFLLIPLTVPAHKWTESHLPGKTMTFGPGIVVEHRYIGDIFEGIQSDGLTVE